MGVQTTYKFATPIGQPGGIVDGFTPYAVNSFCNEAADGAVKPGMGVVHGTAPGATVKLPVSASTAAKFEGIVTNRRTNENTMTGAPIVKEGQTLGVMKYGCIYGIVAEDVEPAYGDPVYLITSGDEAGCFTNAAAGQGDSFTTVAVKGQFNGGVSDGIAPIWLFNQAQA